MRTRRGERMNAADTGRRGFLTGVAATVAVFATVAAISAPPEPRRATRPPSAPSEVGGSRPPPEVQTIGLTVSDLDRSVAFFRDVLSFEVDERYEASGRDWELLTGVFGARTRTARMHLGDERIELTEFLAPRGRDYPDDTRANDE